MKNWLFAILLVLIHLIVGQYASNLNSWLRPVLYLALIVLDLDLYIQDEKNAKEEKEDTPVFDDDSILDSNYQSLR